MLSSAEADLAAAGYSLDVLTGRSPDRGLMLTGNTVFPDDIEPPLILLGEGRRRDVMRLAVSGDLNERELVDFARQIETGLLSRPEISLVELSGIRRGGDRNRESNK